MYCKCNTSTGSWSHYQYKAAGKKNLQSKVQLIEKKLVFAQTKRENDKKIRKHCNVKQKNLMNPFWKIQVATCQLSLTLSPQYHC